MPDTTTYIEKLLAGLGDEDPMGVQETTAEKIRGLTEGLTAAQLAKRPQPEKWSIVENVAHLAEDELVSSWRYRQMIEAPGCNLPGFDQDKWAALGRYGEWSLGEALEMFRLLREANLKMLRQLRPEQRAAFGYHAERGRITVEELCRHMAAHDLNHLEHIRRIASGGV